MKKALLSIAAAAALLTTTAMQPARADGGATAAIIIGAAAVTTVGCYGGHSRLACILSPVHWVDHVFHPGRVRVRSRKRK